MFHKCFVWEISQRDGNSFVAKAHTLIERELIKKDILNKIYYFRLSELYSLNNKDRDIAINLSKI